MIARPTAASPGAARAASANTVWSRQSVALSPGPWLTYPATADAVGTARHETVRIARAVGASERLLEDIELAVSEAFTNAVVHAYASAGIRGTTFTVSTQCRGTRFFVWVADEGRGVPASTPSHGIGLGLELMASACESVQLGVLDDGRTQVEMRFDLGRVA